MVAEFHKERRSFEITFATKRVVGFERSAAAVIGLSKLSSCHRSRHGGIMTYLFIARFLARCALIGARRCRGSAKRRAAFTSLADSEPGHREARAGRVREHDKLLRVVSN